MATPDEIIKTIDSNVVALQAQAQVPFGALEVFATGWEATEYGEKFEFPSEPWISGSRHVFISDYPELTKADYARESGTVSPAAPAVIGPKPEIGTVTTTFDAIPTMGTLPDLKTATLEEDIEGNKVFDSHVWRWPDLDVIEAQLVEWIRTGGVGISQDVQDAIFNADYERRQQTLRDGMDLAGARAGAKGFRYPNSMVKAAQNELLQKNQFELAERSRELTRMIADLAQKNVQFAITQVAAIEGMHSNFAIQYADLLNRVRTLLMEKYKLESSAYLEEYKIVTGVELEKYRVGTSAVLDKNKTMNSIELDRFKTVTGVDLEAYKTESSAELDRFRIQSSAYIDEMRMLYTSAIEKYRADATVYATEFEGKMTQILRQVEVAKVNQQIDDMDLSRRLEVWKQEVEYEFRQAQLDITKAQEASEVRIKSADALGRMYVQLLGSYNVNGVAFSDGSTK